MRVESGGSGHSLAAPIMAGNVRSKTLDLMGVIGIIHSVPLICPGTKKLVSGGAAHFSHFKLNRHSHGHLRQLIDILVSRVNVEVVPWD